MEDKARPAAIRGLEGVIAAETRIGYVDGVNGKLYYAGYDVNDLARHATYEECVYLLWNDRLPNKKELTAFRSDLVKEMTLPGPLVQWFKRVPVDATVVWHLAGCEEHETLMVYLAAIGNHGEKPG